MESPPGADRQARYRSRPRQHQEGRQQLALTHPVGDRLHVHRMNREDQSRGERSRFREKATRQPHHQDGDQDIEQGVHGVKRQRRALSDRPFEGEQLNREGAIEQAERPVRGGPDPQQGVPGNAPAGFRRSQAGRRTPCRYRARRVRSGARPPPARRSPASSKRRHCFVLDEVEGGAPSPVWLVIESSRAMRTVRGGAPTRNAESAVALIRRQRSAW